MYSNNGDSLNGFLSSIENENSNISYELCDKGNSVMQKSINSIIDKESGNKSFQFKKKLFAKIAIIFQKFI